MTISTKGSTKGDITGNNSVGIIGGGIAGLASAIALAKAGKEVDVFEKATAFKEVGAGIQIGPNAVSALKALGVYDAIQDQAYAPQHILIKDGLTGKLLNRLHLGEGFEQMFKQPYRVIHRADLLNGLVETAKTFPNIKLHTAKALTSLNISETANTCTYEDGSTSSHDMLIGADGFRSVVRRHVLNDGPPIYANHSLFRVLMPMQALENTRDVLDVNLWLYPGGHVVHYPVSNAKQVNIVAAVEQHWSKRGWSIPSDSTEVLQHFSVAHDTLQQLLATPKNWLKWAAAGYPNTNTWHLHNAVLIGDAAHPTLPYMAQGAAMAIEDAICLGAHIQNQRPISQFAAVRRERTHKVVNNATKLGRIYHMSSPSRWARNAVIRSTSSTRQFKRMSWLYNWHAPNL